MIDIEQMLADDMAQFEANLQDWGIAELREYARMEGLSGRSKDSLIKALVAHRLHVLMPAKQESSKRIHEGFFTVVGQSRYTFRIERQDDDASFAPGQLIIASLTGPDNEADYQGFGFVSENGVLRIWKKARVSQQTVNAANFLLRGDMANAGKMYALESGNCWRCNRLLTTVSSIEAGIGPVCAGKVA